MKAQTEAELAVLIDRALALADELELEMVGIKLDEARLALGVSKDTPESLAAFDGRMPSGQPSPSRSSADGKILHLHPQASLEQLLAEHDLLDGMRRSLMELVKGPFAPFAAARRLAAFSNAIKLHRLSEQRCVYGPLLATGLGDDLRLGVSFREFASEIEGSWSYLKEWTVDRIAADWVTFGKVTHRVLTRAGERMRLEDEIIYPLALRNGMIRAREAG